MKDNSVDAIIIDPPYNISMSSWDTFDSNVQFQKWIEKWGVEANRVLKPGAYLLSFASPRLQHRVASGLENSGFKIKDTMEWIYATGMPKSFNISKGFDKRLGHDRPPIEKGKAGLGKQKNLGYGYGFKKDYWETADVSNEAKQWHGWGTSLKPAHESIIMAQKEIEGSILSNVKKWGVGAINIQESLIPYADEKDKGRNAKGKPFGSARADTTPDTFESKKNSEGNPIGRFPSNVVLTDPLFDDHDRYFLIPKPSHSEKTHDDAVKNDHLTVKPRQLMDRLINMVTKKGDLVVDIFAGSGTTLVSAKENCRNFIGFDIGKEFVDLARSRVDLVTSKCESSQKTKRELVQNNP